LLTPIVRQVFKGREAHKTPTLVRWWVKHITSAQVGNVRPFKISVTPPSSG